ncbi:hypothetical protein V8F20_005706 [Naviculisporaceae sp. PSN 640]
MAGQKRPSGEADIPESSTPSGSQAQPDLEAEPALKRARIETSIAESPDEPNHDALPSEAQAGWNDSVGTGLRTSFGLSTKLKLDMPQPDANSPSAESHEDNSLGDEETPDKESCGEGSSEDESPKGTSPDSNESSILGGWTIPKLSALSAKVLKKTDLKTRDTWEARLREWYSAVAAANSGKEGLKEPSIFLDIWSQWLKQQGPKASVLKKGLKMTTVEYLGAKRINAMINPESKPDKKPADEPETTSSNWIMPPSVDAAVLELPETEQALWFSKFLNWIQEFADLNANMVAVTDEVESRICAFYQEWLQSHNVNRKQARMADRMAKAVFKRKKRQLHKMLTGGDESTMAPQVRPGDRVPVQASSPSEGEINEDEDDDGTNGTAETERFPSGPILFNWDMTNDSPSGTNGSSQIPELPEIPLVAEPIKLLSAEEELEYRANYYPGVLPNETFCLNCANHGHTTRECPLLTCRWCGVWGHPYLRCPTRHRCTKCRQLGHEGAGCTEKLALTRDEMDCARCGAKDHLENRCYEIFRSTFNPPPERIRKVRALPIFCAQCGEEGHYWTECGLNARWVTKADKAGLSSATIRKVYIDPECDNVAVCYQATSGYQIRGAAAAAAAEGRPAHLNGKSIAPKRHVEYFEEDDDDDDQFIRPPPPKRLQPGKITFSRQSRGGGGGGGGRFNNGYSNNNGNGGRSNPPLPPGPPPSGPKGGSRRGGGGSRGGGRRGGRGRY